MPAGHGEHVDSPGDAEYLPAPQSSQALSLAAPSIVEYLPEGHIVHVASVEAPAADEYLPFPQLRHVDCCDAPSAVEYLPAPHGTQSAAAEWPSVVRNVPAGQFSHVLLEVAPHAVEYLPAPHCVQLALPLALLYSPEGHSVQADRASPVYPALHTHSLNDCAPADEKEPAGQASHWSLVAW